MSAAADPRINAIAERERQAEISGRAYNLTDSKAVAEAYGIEAARIALVVRAEMLNTEGSALEADALLRRLHGGTA